MVHSIRKVLPACWKARQQILTKLKRYLLTNHWAHASMRLTYGITDKFYINLELYMARLTSVEIWLIKSEFGNVVRAFPVSLTPRL